MLELVCYLFAVVLAAISALVPNLPYRDRFFAAAFCAYAIPAFVHAVQAH